MWKAHILDGVSEMKPTKEHLIEYMQLLILFHEPKDHVTLLGDIFDEIELLKAIKRELEK